MIVDARELADGTELRADVCIVGSGPAGVTLALELQGSGLDVLVLEAGGLEFEQESQDLYEVDMTGELFGAEGSPVPVSATRLRYLGGTSGHWAGYCRPLRPVDLEPRPEHGRPGWPIEFDEIDRHYPRALEILELGPNRFDHAFWDDHADIGPTVVNDDAVETVVYQVSPTQFGTRYRDELDAAGDIRVVLHANVTGIVPAESGRTVERLDVATRTGRRHTAVARRYVVATGGIETARLLLVSAPERGGVGNDHDLVGRGFCEHGQNTLGIATFSPTVDDLRAYRRADVPGPDGSGRDGTISVQGALLLGDEALRREGLLGIEAQFLALSLDEAPPGAVSGPTLADAGDLLRSFDRGGPGAMAGFSVTAEQAPNPSSRITLTDEVDALGLPRAALNWVVSDDDRRSIVRGLEIMGARLGAAGAGRLQVTAGSLQPSGEGGLLGRFEVDPSKADPTGFHLAHANHHCCTVPMSADPSSGVCDPDLKVWGFEDLHVAGSGAFTSAGVTSPTISIVALSVRLAAHLREALA
ncbi:MAG: GMC family oxidoreductase [Acidimicrobiales bacterium]|nr:GMC family oxidoreductase [Acidimicrobiales bacterium]